MPPLIKQTVVLRRRAGLTVKQFRDYHYQRHGRISGETTPEETPLVYYQTHIFDSVYSNHGLAQPAWTGHNGMTELYFADEAAIGRVFGSQHVRDVVGPDGKNFNDFAAAIPMFAIEEVIAGDADAGTGEQQAVVATLYYQNKKAGGDFKEFGAALNPLIASAFGGLATKVVANVALPDEKGMLKYFKGEEAPLFDACYQVYLEGQERIEAFLEAEKDLREKVKDLVVGETSFVVFGVRSVVLDRRHGIQYHDKRQPRIP